MLLGNVLRAETNIHEEAAEILDGHFKQNTHTQTPTSSEEQLRCIKGINEVAQ